MKILTILFFLASLNAFGATCTTTTRTNYSSGQTLTSAALNADFNQLVTKVNSLDGGCVTDNTIEASALNSTDFAAVKNGIHQGCALAYSDANTISVGKCILSVNGNFVKTALANTVTWGCSGCSSELASTTYYVYAKSGSSGTTLNLLISSTAPDADGYDGSGNKVLGMFFNNSSSAIQSVYSWGSSHFESTSTPVETFSFYYSGGGAFNACSSGECALVKVGNYVTSVTRTSLANYDILFGKTYTAVNCLAQIIASDGFPGRIEGVGKATNSNTLSIATSLAASPYTGLDSSGIISCWGY